MSHATALAGGPDGGPGGRVRRQKKEIALVLLAAIALAWLAHSCADPRDDRGAHAQPADGDASTVETAGSGDIIVNQTSRVSGLAPGKPAQELRGTFINLTDAPIYVRSVRAVVAGTSNRDCTAKDFVIHGSPATVAANVAPGSGQGSWSGITIRFDNQAVNQDACRKVRVNIAYSST